MVVAGAGAGGMIGALLLCIVSVCIVRREERLGGRENGAKEQAKEGTSVCLFSSRRVWYSFIHL